MKKKGIFLILVTALILGTLGSAVLAGNRSDSLVNTNVVQLLQGTINVEYERVLNSGTGLYASPSLLISSDLTNFGVRAGLKKYFWPTAPEGFWFGGHGYLSYVSAGRIVSGTAFSAGADVGYKYFLTDSFIIEGPLGLTYAYMSTNVLGYPQPADGAFVVTSRVGIGYAF